MVCVRKTDWLGIRRPMRVEILIRRIEVLHMLKGPIVWRMRLKEQARAVSLQYVGFLFVLLPLSIRLAWLFVLVVFAMESPFVSRKKKEVHWPDSSFMPSRGVRDFGHVNVTWRCPTQHSQYSSSYSIWGSSDQRAYVLNGRKKNRISMRNTGFKLGWLYGIPSSRFPTSAIKLTIYCSPPSPNDLSVGQNIRD